jgi:hypothetical protein
MANPNALFGVIEEVARGNEREGTRISLGGNAVARLDPNDKRASALAGVLEDRGRRKMPVYIEVDPGTGFVARVYIPKLTRVERIVEEGGKTTVMLERSHARHTVRDADALRALREAGKDKWLAVTVNDQFEIIDVRPYQPAFDVPRFEPPPPKPSLKWWQWLFWPWWWFSCVSMARAQQLFDLCALRTCAPTTVPPPCIPFMYPDDGCWARAHEMCRLMMNDGASPRKVWIDGILHTPTKNHPDCFVEWGWHVAPTVCVRKWLFFKVTMVIDPSLFTTPVTPATWKSVQGDPSAVLSYTTWDVFWHGGGGDPGFVWTEQILQDYRDALQTRSLSAVGPPPYANC